MNKTEAKVPDRQRDWQAIEIFLFSNGQESSPPRKYHLRADELDWWDATLNQLARLHYGIQHPGIYLYTTDGRPVEGPLELRDGVAYVAVEPQDDFIEAGYEKYLIKASKSWEKRQARKKKPACGDDRPCCNCTEKGDAVTELDNERFKSPITGAVETLPSEYKPKSGEDGPVPTEYENKLAEYEHKLPENKPELTEYRPKLVGYVPSPVYEPKYETGGISNKHRLDEHETKPYKKYGNNFSNYAVEPAEREVNSNKNGTKISETDNPSGEQKPRHDEYIAGPNKTGSRLDQSRPDKQLSNEYRARSDEVVPGKGEPLLNAGESRRNELSTVDDNQTSFNEIIAREDELETRSTKLEPKLDSHGYSLSENENKDGQDKAWVDENYQSMDEQVANSGICANNPRNQTGRIDEHEQNLGESRSREDVTDPHDLLLNRQESKVYREKESIHPYRESEIVSQGNKGENRRNGVEYQNIVFENLGRIGELSDRRGDFEQRTGKLRGKENDHLAKTSENGRKDINSEKRGAKQIPQRKKEAGPEDSQRNSNGRAEDFVRIEGDHSVTEPTGIDTVHGVRADDLGVRAENIGKNQRGYKIRPTEQSDKEPDRVAAVGDLGDKAGNIVTNLDGGTLGRNAAEHGVRAFEQRNRATLLRGDDQGSRTNDYGPRVGNHGPRVSDLGGRANRHRGKEEGHMSRAGDLTGRVIENKTKVGDPETKDNILRRIADETGAGVSSGARNGETGARVSIGARGGELGTKFNARGRIGETGNRASSGGRAGENGARASLGSRTGESGLRASSGGRDGNTGPRVSIGVRNGETGARLSAGGKAGETGNRASSARKGGETGARASLGGKTSENGNRARSGSRCGETGVKTNLGARGGETKTRIYSGERGVETGVKSGEPKPKLTSGDRNSEFVARTSPGARPGMPNATAEPVSGLGEPEPRDINGATGFVRRSNLSGEKPSSRRPTLPLLPSIPPTITEGKKNIKSNRESLLKKLTVKAPIRSLNASAPFSEPKVEPKYPHKSFTPPVAPPPAGNLNQTIIQRKSNSLTKIMSNHRNLASDNAPVENVIGDKENMNVVSTNIYRNFESEVQSMRLDSGERRTMNDAINYTDETQIEQTIVQQQSKCSNECIVDNEEVQTVTKHELIEVDDKDAVEIIANSKIELTRTSSRQRDNTASTDDPEENYISIINKGDVVNLKLNIEVRNAGRSDDGSQNDQRSRSFTNVTRIEKESQISFNDDIYMQSKSLQSLLNNEYFKGSGFEGCPKVVVVQCPCCAHKRNNRPGYDATSCNDNKKYVVLMANSQLEDSDDKCCCEPTCHVYGQNVNPQSRKTSIYNPVKKTFSNMSLETMTVWESGVCKRHDVHMTTTNSTVQTDAEKSDTSSNKRKVSITADYHMDYKKSTSQIFGSQTQFIINKNSNCVQACQGKCSQVEPQMSTQVDSHTCLQGCPVIQLRDCLKACSRACPKVLSQDDPLAILQVQSQGDLQACPQTQSQGSSHVCPHVQTQEGSQACSKVQSQGDSQAYLQVQSQGGSHCCQVQSQGSSYACSHVQSQGGSHCCPQVQSQESPHACSHVQLQGGSHCCPQVQSQRGAHACSHVQSKGVSHCCPQVQSQRNSHVCPHVQTQGGLKACSQVQMQEGSQVSLRVQSQGGSQAYPQVQSQGDSHCCLQAQSQRSSHVCPHVQMQGGSQACPRVQKQESSQAYPQVQRQGSSQPCSHVRSHGGSQTYLEVQSQGCSQACAPQTMQIQSQIRLITPTLQVQSQQALQIQSQVCPQKRSQGCTQIRPQVSDAHTQTEWCNVLLEVRRHENGRYSFHLPPLHVLRYYTN